MWVASGGFFQAASSPGLILNRNKRIFHPFTPHRRGCMLCRPRQEIQRLNEMQALKLSVAAKASAQRLTSGIQNLILDKLLKLIP
jgi:hypothetical protein